MSGRSELLRETMLLADTTQMVLSRMSGIHQPSISQFLSGKVEMSDSQLDRLLQCMGFRLDVVRRASAPELTRSEERSWKLHRAIAPVLSRESLRDWTPIINRNLERLRNGVTGQPHERNLDNWAVLINENDLSGIKRVLTGLDRASIEMREVSPMSGILTHEERLRALGLAA